MKKTEAKKTEAARAANKTPATIAKSPEAKNDAVPLLKSDHRTVEKLFTDFEKAGNDSDEANSRREIAQKICRALIVHTTLEEEIFYPACRRAGVEDDMLAEAQVEHDGAKVMIADILRGDPGDDFYNAKVTVLAEYIRHHVREEEKPGGIFAKARKAGLDTTTVGARLQARKAELTGETPERRPLTAVSLALQDIHPNTQENTMPRNSNQRDRDDHGRFTSDDDNDHRDRNMSSRSNDGNRNYDDNRGRFSGGRGNQDRDDQGHFMRNDDDNRSQQGRSSRSSNFDDNQDDNRSRASSGRDHGGWFGNSEGHSRAAQERGGQNRSNARYDQDDNRGYGSRGGDNGNDRDRDNHGRFMSDDDEDRSRYGSSRSGGQSNRDGNGGNSRDRDDRGRFTSDDHQNDGGRSSRSNYGDDNRHSSQRGHAQDSGYRGSSRGQSHQAQQSQGHEGHGGWFGDHDGHSEAARRGWQHRG